MNKQLTHIGEIPISSLKSNYIRIENLKQYMLDIKHIDPLNEMEYMNYWRDIKKKVVEGMWGKESKGYRYAPGSLFFYANFGLIQDTDENKITTNIRPLIRDLEWEIFYMFLEAEGFSGFHLDDNFSSDSLLLQWKKNSITRIPESYREKQLYRKDGTLKEYVKPRDNIRKLHHSPKGVPLFFNEAKNVSILGS